MKFIVQDARTRELLKSTGKSASLLTFFFWENGVDLQKSQVGLLRSLIYQLLESMDSQKRLQAWRGIIQPNISALPTVWTSESLLRLLGTVLETVEQRFCLFIDGLDEFSGDPDRVEPIIALYSIFKSHGNFKLCISSRPQPDLRVLYGSCPGLSTQALTKGDIRHYVEDELLNSPLAENLAHKSSIKTGKLVEAVVSKAEGVFLWVTLVVQSLLRGIRNEDSWDDLQERLKQLPASIFGLYTHMWKRSAVDQPIYAKEAAIYLQLVQRFHRMNLVDMAILVDNDLHAQFAGPASTWDMGHFRAKVEYQRTEKRVVACCAGFLEVYDYKAIALDGETENYHVALAESSISLTSDLLQELVNRYAKFRSASVQFAHRTVAEYLSTPLGQDVLRANPYTKHDLNARHLKTILISTFLSPPRLAYPWSLHHSLNHRCLWHVGGHEAAGVFFDLESISQKIFAWKIWNVDRAPLHWLNSDGSVDYTHAFIDFSHPEYTKMKLEMTGRANSQEYLTSLRSWWVSSIGSYWGLGLPLEDFFGNAQLLLNLGASPNGPVGPIRKLSGVFNMTIWIYLFVELSARIRQLEISALFSFDEENPGIDLILRAFMRSGADVIGGITCYSEELTDIEKAIEHSNPGQFRPFMLCKWSVLDLASSWISPDGGISRILQQFGSASAQKRFLWYLPPNTWYISNFYDGTVTSTSVFGRRLTSGNRYCYEYSFGYPAPGEPVNQGLQWKLRNPQMFDTYGSGMEAIEAAGWTIEEMQKEPCLEELCRWLLRSTDSEERSLEGEMLPQERDDDKLTVTMVEANDE